MLAASNAEEENRDASAGPGQCMVGGGRPDWDHSDHRSRPPDRRVGGYWTVRHRKVTVGAAIELLTAFNGFYFERSG